MKGQMMRVMDVSTISNPPFVDLVSREGERVQRDTDKLATHSGIPVTDTSELR